MIRFEQVTKALGGRMILEDISFEIPERETVFIVGFSGAGKSVTLRHMVRLLTPDRGRVLIDGECISSARRRRLEALRRRFGYLFQGSALLQWLTVRQNIALPLREVSRMKEEEIDPLVVRTLARVGLEDAVEKFPAELSGGMRKRVALARAIVTSPDIILYDEPTSGLDPVTARTIDSLIDELRNALGVTSVVVTHDLHSALRIGTRIMMLNEGHIVEDADAAGFIESKNEHVQRFLESQYINRRGEWETATRDGAAAARDPADT